MSKSTNNIGDKYYLKREGCHFRVIAAKDFWCGDTFVKRATVGGLIDSYHNLSQSGNCWVAKNASVCDTARVEGDALITDDAIVCADSVVKDNAIISGDCQVACGSVVGGDTVVTGSVELVDVEILGGHIEFKPKSGALHVNNYSQKRDLIIDIKTVVYDGKDKREKESEEEYRKHKFKEHKETYKEFCRIRGR